MAAISIRPGLIWSQNAGLIFIKVWIHRLMDAAFA